MLHKLSSLLGDLANVHPICPSSKCEASNLASDPVIVLYGQNYRVMTVSGCNVLHIIPPAPHTTRGGQWKGLSDARGPTLSRALWSVAGAPRLYRAPAPVAAGRFGFWVPLQSWDCGFTPRKVEINLFTKTWVLLMSKFLALVSAIMSSSVNSPLSTTAQQVVV